MVMKLCIISSILAIMVGCLLLLIKDPKSTQRSGPAPAAEVEICTHQFGSWGDPTYSMTVGDYIQLHRCSLCGLAEFRKLKPSK